ncbi:MAG: alanine racemase [Gaiellales bacterium]
MSDTGGRDLPRRAMTASGTARSVVTIDLDAVRHNVRLLREVVSPAAVWAVVKANAYGHGAVDIGRAALEAGAEALCVATAGEGVQLRAALGPDARLLVLGPTGDDELRDAREARLELTAHADGAVPTDVLVHLKLDTGMGRWGLSELLAPDRNVVGLMTHFASSEADPVFTRRQLDAFLTATAPHPEVPRHAANSAAAIGFPDTRLDAVRCGIAIYGIDPYGNDAVHHGLRPALQWTSAVARVTQLHAGQSTGYGRRFVASEPTWIAQVPVGYADGFARSLTGTRVLVDEELCEVIGTISMDAMAVKLAAPCSPGTPVTLVGDGVTFEQHARVAGTIAYELACAVRAESTRTRRVVRA